MVSERVRQVLQHLDEDVHGTLTMPAASAGEGTELLWGLVRRAVMLALQAVEVSDAEQERVTEEVVRMLLGLREGRVQ